MAAIIEPVVSPSVQHMPATASCLNDRTSIGTLDVPQLGIGTISWTSGTNERYEEVGKIAHTAKACGLDFFDTAERYGASPLSLIPSALAACNVPIDPSYIGGDCESNLAGWGKGAQVATKFTPTPWRRDSLDVVEAARASMQRLNVDRLALYQIHMPDIIQPFSRLGRKPEIKDAIYWDGLAEAYHEGIVANVGVSNYGPTLVARAQEHLARRGVPLASNQIAFNLLSRRQGNLETVDYCRDLGVAVLAYYPLAMGLLSGKVTASSLAHRRDSRANDLRRYLQGGQGGTAGNIPKPGITPLLQTLQAVSAGRRKTPAQVALNWVICKGAIPISGASSVMQVEDNFGALNWRLTPTEINMLDEAADELEFDFNGCGFQTTTSKFVGYGFEEWKLD